MADKKEDRDRGRFKKGREKTGGRKKGTPNKNGNVRDRLREQVEPFIDQIGQKLKEVAEQEGTKEMLTLLEKFMPYFMPKYSALSVAADQDRPINEEERLLELDAKYTKRELSINIKSLTVVDNDKPKTDDDGDEDPDFDVSELMTEAVEN